MMKNKIFNLLLLFISIAGQLACSDKIEENGNNPDEGQVHLSGALTRANGDLYPNLYLKAVVDVDTSQVYIAETPFTVPDGLEEAAPNDIVFTNGSPYYPLGDNEIRFFAYSRPLDSYGRMQLTSGTGLENDAILSNQGYREGVTGLTPERVGTPGSAKAPATLLQFRHVMTRIDVVIQVDSTELPTFVDPPPKEIYLGIDGIWSGGAYLLTNAAPELGNEAGAAVATDLTGSYLLREGTNYVVPTGQELTAGGVLSLQIDDYTATAADLAALAVTNLVAGAAAPLVSGYAYTLTVNLRRLGVGSILLEHVEWDTSEVTPEDIGYDSYALTLDLGEYDDTAEEDWITKVILWSDDGKEYVGESNATRDAINFVLLPQTAVDSVALYTELGMLIRMEPDSYTYSGTTGTLALQLTAGGMRLENPSGVPGPTNPYLIYTPVQIFNIAKDLTGTYQQMADLDISRLTYAGRALLEPLGTFTGMFDGNGYRLNNMVLTGPGLVERNEGVLKNINIDSGRINADGETVAGSLCAVNAGIIVACINGAKIANAVGTVGGICGENEATGRIIACVNTGDVENGVLLGGICGSNQNTDQYAIMACINTGLLAKSGTTIGGIIGESADSPDIVVLNSFWLVGTAAHEFGGMESAVGSGTVVSEEVTALSPEKLRDDLSAPSDTEPTLELLNDALDLSPYAGEFEYVLDQNVTGMVWPVPVKI